MLASTPCSRCAGTPPGSCPSTSSSSIADPKTYDFNPPVGLGPYTLNSFDPNGAWYIWEKRADWDKTAMAAVGRACSQVRHLSFDPVAGQAAHRDGQRRPRHDPRPVAGRHVQPGQAGAHRTRLVPGLPLCPSRSDAADDHPQQPEPQVPGQARPLGSGADARSGRNVDGVATAVRRRSRRSRCRRPARIPTTTSSRCRIG